MGEKFKPGMISDCDCEYELYDSNGQSTGMRVTMQKGETFPPSDHEGEFYCRCGNKCGCDNCDCY